MKKNKATIIKSQPRVFRSLTGMSLEKFMSLYLSLHPIYKMSEKERFSRSNRKRSQGGGRKKDLTLEEQLLMTLMYYRLYVSQTFLGLIFNLHNSNVSRQINYISPLLQRIFKIPERKLKLSEAEISEDKLIEFFIDATEQPIRRPKKKQKRYYSGKKKKHTLKSQIITDDKGKIKSTSGSVPGSKHDKKLFDESKMESEKEMKFIGDLGYYGSNRIKVPIKKPKKQELTREEKRYNREFARERVLIEHVIGKMKIFQILNQQFRNKRSKHSLIVKNIAGIYNLMFS